MASPAQIYANRQNAKKSHGAVTPAGRLASSHNATKHGLCYNDGNFFLLAGEDPEAFDRLWADLTAEHKPQTPTEHIIVRHMVHHEWLRGRAIRLQETCFVSGALKETAKFALYLRYQAMHERGFFKCLRELQNLRAERRKEQIGLDSLQLKIAADQRADKALILREKSFEFKKEQVEIRNLPQKGAPPIQMAA